MAWMEVHGITELMNDFATCLDIPDSVATEMLNAEADVIVEAQQKAMKEMWNGRYATGETARSIKKKRVVKLRYGHLVLVRPEGENRKGERYGAVAFINEYGKRGQPGRPAIRTANEKAVDKAVAAGEKVYHAFLDSKKL